MYKEAAEKNEVRRAALRVLRGICPKAKTRVRSRTLVALGWRLLRQPGRAGCEMKTIFTILKKWNVDDDMLTALKSELE